MTDSSLTIDCTYSDGLTVDRWLSAVAAVTIESMGVTPPWRVGMVKWVLGIGAFPLILSLSVCDRHQPLLNTFGVHTHGSFLKQNPNSSVHTSKDVK